METPESVGSWLVRIASWWGTDVETLLADNCGSYGHRRHTAPAPVTVSVGPEMSTWYLVLSAVSELQVHEGVASETGLMLNSL